MILKTFLSFLASVLFIGISFAHHGGASFNNEVNIAVRGKVTRFDFINPHVLIYIEATDDNGDTVEWSGEITSPNRLARRELAAGAVRWSKDVLQPGDVIVLGGNPARNGSPFLRHSIILYTMIPSIPQCPEFLVSSFNVLYIG